MMLQHSRWPFPNVSQIMLDEMKIYSRVASERRRHVSCTCAALIGQKKNSQLIIRQSSERIKEWEAGGGRKTQQPSPIHAASNRSFEFSASTTRQAKWQEKHSVKRTWENKRDFNRYRPTTNNITDIVSLAVTILACHSIRGRRPWPTSVFAARNKKESPRSGDESERRNRWRSRRCTTHSDTTSQRTNEMKHVVQGTFIDDSWDARA